MESTWIRFESINYKFIKFPYSYIYGFMGYMFDEVRLYIRGILRFKMGLLIKMYNQKKNCRSQ